MNAMLIILLLFSLYFNFGKSKYKYVYGICKNKHARMSVKTGKVYFVLWRAGEQGHMVEYWREFDNSWWIDFKAYDEDQINSESRH